MKSGKAKYTKGKKHASSGKSPKAGASVKNVAGGDKLQSAVNRINKGPKMG